MSEAKPIKVALIGAGGWGLQHARIFAARPDVDFCAIVGQTEEKTRTRAETFGVRYYLDIDQMLEKEQPDLVSLCLPNQGHFKATLRVITAGFPLLVEKPLVNHLKRGNVYPWHKCFMTHPEFSGSLSNISWLPKPEVSGHWEQKDDQALGERRSTDD